MPMIKCGKCGAPNAAGRNLCCNCQTPLDAPPDSQDETPKQLARLLSSALSSDKWRRDKFGWKEWVAVGILVAVVVLYLFTHFHVVSSSTDGT